MKINIIKKKAQSYFKKRLSNRTYNLLRFIYRLFFENYKYFMKPVGFINKTKIDFRKLILNKLTKIKIKDLTVIGDDSLFVFNENNGYEKLTGFKHVLDLGAYIGDSPLILSINNQKISSYEPDKEKFDLLKKNIKINKLQNRIKCFNYGVISGKEKFRKFYSNHSMSDRSSFYQKHALNEYLIKCKDINNILEEDNFDALKCDIEGGEWELIEWFLNNKSKFLFKAGIFELHFSKERIQIEFETTKKFCEFLNKKQYYFYFYTNKIYFKKNNITNIKPLIDKEMKDSSNSLVGLMMFFKKIK